MSVETVQAVRNLRNLYFTRSAVQVVWAAAVITMALVKSRGRIAQFGNARFAMRRDIVKAGLLEK